jgi:hypothetical protein
MKQTLTALSRRYVTVSRKSLKQGPRAIPPRGTALGLERQAVTFGPEMHPAVNAASDPGVI